MDAKDDKKPPAAAPAPAPWYIQYRCWILAAIAAILAVFLLVAWWRMAAAVPASGAPAKGGRRARGGARTHGGGLLWTAGGGCGCVLP